MLRTLCIRQRKAGTFLGTLCSVREEHIIPTSLKNYSSPTQTASASSSSSDAIDNLFKEENVVRLKKDLKTIPPSRRFPKSLKDGKNLPQAAVLVPFCHIDGRASVIFTLRSSDLSSHRGHVSFPGGKLEDADKGLVDCALRETHEEVGLDLSKVDVYGELSKVPSKNFEMAVTPVLAYCGHVELEQLKHNPQEVEQVFHAPVEALCRPGAARYTTFGHKKFQYTLPVYHGVAEHRIWGLTAVILHLAMKIVTPDIYKLKIPGEEDFN